MVKFLRLVFFGFLILLFTELGLRFLDPPSLSYFRSIKLLHRYHPTYYVTLGKNLDIYVKHYAGLWEGRFTTNSLGFRGSPEPDKTLPKIACLGDSLVMGFGVSDEDSFCYLLNGISIDGKEFQALNLAVDAYGSLGSAKRLKESMEFVDLDKVLFFVSPNDFTVPPGLVEQGVLADDIVEKQRENDDAYRFRFRIQFELTRFSYLLQALKLSQEQLSIKRLMAKKEIESEWTSLRSPLAYLKESFYRFPQTECNKNIQPRDQVEDKSTGYTSGKCVELPLSDSGCMAGPPDPSTWEALPEETIYAYNLMLDAIREKNTELIVVYIPMQNEDIRCNNAGLHSPLYNYSLRSKKFFESKGIRTIDLMNYSEEICPIGEFFIPGDGHLTIRGNKWVSDKLRRVLTEEITPNPGESF